MEPKNVETKQFGLHFGALADSVREQLKSQGFKFDKNEVSHFEKDVDALNRLRIRGYLNDSSTDKATKKLYNKIQAHVAKVNKLKVLKKAK
jgi:hypothetical protein